MNISSSILRTTIFPNSFIKRETSSAVASSKVRQSTYTPMLFHASSKQAVLFPRHLLDSIKYTGGDVLSYSASKLYRLPTVWYNGEIKKTIVDPTFIYRAYELPTCVSRDLKEVPMSQGTKGPVADPAQIPDVVKVTLPYLMTIRHKKMKRHKLKKLRKRMRFLMRKRRAVLQRKKEQAIQEVERKFAKEAADYDPEKFIEEQMSLARKSGWGIDVIAEHAKKSSGHVAVKHNSLNK